MPFLFLNAVTACLTMLFRPHYWPRALKNGATKIACARTEARAINLHARLAGDGE